MFSVCWRAHCSRIRTEERGGEQENADEIAYFRRGLKPRHSQWPRPRQQTVDVLPSLGRSYSVRERREEREEIVSITLSASLFGVVLLSVYSVR
jgi:hypothetical protein